MNSYLDMKQETYSENLLKFLHRDDRISQLTKNSQSFNPVEEAIFEKVSDSIKALKAHRETAAAAAAVVIIDVNLSFPVSIAKMTNPVNAGISHRDQWV
jgi:hypothetical protein